MKKLLMLIAFIGLVAGLSAQDPTIYKVGSPTQVVDATITNTGADTVDILLRIPSGEPWGYSLHMVAANVSGTTDIDVSYQWSNDGTNFVQHTADSLASGNLQYLLEDVDGFGARYMRIISTGVGTQSSTIDGYLYPFKVPGR
jgi:hypothetical protein